MSRASEQMALPTNPDDHSMGAALCRYVALKAHSHVQAAPERWRRILVIGRYDRRAIVSGGEKSEKLFNVHRPTARVDHDDLTLCCFPGKDYVFHYAKVVATYLRMIGHFRGQVSYVTPTDLECDLNLFVSKLPPFRDVPVVLGYGLERLAGFSGWQHSGICAWKIHELSGTRVMLLGFFPSIWGDIAGRVVALLSERKPLCILYVGKVGSIDPNHLPNSVVATGCSSVLRGRMVTWDDWIGRIAGNDVANGVHVTSRSTLLETRTWVQRQRDLGRAFVDPEIGHMASVAVRSRIRFGYLHIVSNNLSVEHEQNLSNEREFNVLSKRSHAFAKVWTIAANAVGSL